MGKLVNGINGPFVGKVGNTIGSSWRGIPYIKSRGLRTKPATEGEKLNRFIFSKTQKWLYPLTDFLRVGFKNYTLTNQGVNAAKSYLYKHALIKNGYDSVIDPTLMKVSYGTLPLPNSIEVELTQENQLVFTWDTKSKGRDFDHDQIIMLAYDIDNQDAHMSLNGQFRNTGRDVLDVTTLRNFVVYAAFISADRNSQSDSVYLGQFTRVPKKKVAKKTTSDSKSKETIETPVTIDQAPVAIESTANPAEFVPDNQLSLFDLPVVSVEKQEVPMETEAKLAESSVESEETTLPREIQTQSSEVKMDSEESPDLLVPNDIISKKTQIKPINQKFRYVNPNSIDSSSSIGDQTLNASNNSTDNQPTDGKKSENPKEKIKIKKGKVTWYTTKQHMHLINKIPDPE